jgi:hypothetical protein
MCTCVHGFVLFKIDLPFFHISLCLCSFSFTFSFEHIVFFSQVIRMLSITSLVVPPFQKVCENCHVANVTFKSLISGVYYNVCHSKSIIQKLNFRCGSIVTNDELVLLIIKGKWLEALVHMIEYEFLNLLLLKQVQLLIQFSFMVNFACQPHLLLLAFKSTSNNLSHK